MPEDIVTVTGGGVLTPFPLGGNQEGGKAMTVKQIKRALKKQHKKTTGKRATLMKRLRTKGGNNGKPVNNSQAEESDQESDQEMNKIKGNQSEETINPINPNPEEIKEGGRRHTAKHLKQLLKKHGLKTTGTKRALTRRAKKARLL